MTVCDARETFATKKRFPDADEVIVEWPHRYLARTEVDERTVLCVLTHDPKFDVPLLEIALRTPVAYIGAMGSRRTNDDRIKRLRELGIGEDELARLHAPIGLDVGARTPGGDRGVDRRRDRRGPLGRYRHAVAAHRRPYPPRKRIARRLARCAVGAASMQPRNRGHSALASRALPARRNGAWRRDDQDQRHCRRSVLF